MKAALTALLVAAAIFAGTATASTAWRPGAPYLVSETNMSNAWEKTYDHAFCQGIPRFGHSGEFPYEKFRVFDCSLTRDDGYWPRVRVKSVAARRYGYFRAIVISWGQKL